MGASAAVLLELGELANFTVMGSAAPSGIDPFSFCIALSASIRWSNLMKPTPLERPARRRKEFVQVIRLNEDLRSYKDSLTKQLYKLSRIILACHVIK